MISNDLSEAECDLPLRYRMLYSPRDFRGAISYISELMYVVWDSADRVAFECVCHVDIALGSLLLSVLSAMSVVFVMHSDSMLIHGLSFICFGAFGVKPAMFVYVFTDMLLIWVAY